MLSKYLAKGMSIVLICIAVLAATVTMFSCSEDTDKKLHDLDYTVVSEQELPKELVNIINKKKEGEFRLTFKDGEDMYIAVGYGKQETGGYSIQIPEVYLTKDNIVFKSVLMGPDKKQPYNLSYPYAVIKIEMREEPVIFYY